MNYDSLERPHVVYSPLLWLLCVLFWIIVGGTIYALVMA